MVPSQSGVVCSSGMQESQTMLESLQATCCKVMCAALLQTAAEHQMEET